MSTIFVASFNMLFEVISMEINFELLGKRIAQRRRELGYKQNYLAELADVSNNYLSNIETGRSIPSLSTFATLCICLGTTPDNFLLGTIKTNNIPQSIIDNLKLCDEDSLELVNDFIDLLITRQNKADDIRKNGSFFSRND